MACDSTYSNTLDKFHVRDLHGETIGVYHIGLKIKQKPGRKVFFFGVCVCVKSVEKSLFFSSL